MHIDYLKASKFRSEKSRGGGASFDPPGRSKVKCISAVKLFSIKFPLYVCIVLQIHFQSCKTIFKLVSMLKQKFLL